MLVWLVLAGCYGRNELDTDPGPVVDTAPPIDTGNEIPVDTDDTGYVPDTDVEEETDVPPPPEPTFTCAGLLEGVATSMPETVAGPEWRNDRPSVREIAGEATVLYTDSMARVARRTDAGWISSALPTPQQTGALLPDGVLTYDGGTSATWWDRTATGWSSRWSSTTWVGGSGTSALKTPDGTLHALLVDSSGFTNLAHVRVAADGTLTNAALGAAASFISGAAIAANANGEVHSFFWDARSGTWEIYHEAPNGAITSVYKPEISTITPRLSAAVLANGKPVVLTDPNLGEAATSVVALRNDFSAKTLDSVDASLPSWCPEFPGEGLTCSLDFERVYALDVAAAGNVPVYVWTRVRTKSEWVSSCSGGGDPVAFAAPPPPPLCEWNKLSESITGNVYAACENTDGTLRTRSLGASTAQHGGAHVDADGHVHVATYEPTETGSSVSWRATFRF
jgi:hypothetical protein